MRIPCFVSVIFLLFLVGRGWSQDGCDKFFKQLAGPPSEFPLHSIPTTSSTGIEKRSSFHHLDVQRDELLGAFKASQDIFVDSETLFAFSFFSPLETSLQLQLQDPSGNSVPLEKYAHKGDWTISDDGSTSLPTTTYVFEKPQQGVWKLEVISDKIRELNVTQIPKIAVIVFNESPVRAFTHLSSFFTEKNKDIGLVTLLTEQLEYPQGEVPQALKDVVISAEMDLFLPDGKEEKVEMHDDGLHFDGESGDGVYGATVKATQVGEYLASAVITGKHSNGVTFVRSTEHLLTVVDDEIEFTGYATSTQKDSNRLMIYVEVTKYSPLKHRAYAQVWGRDDNGDEIPICWVGGMAYLEERDSKYVVPLDLDLRWAARAGAKAPFFLKDVWIQEAKTSVPVAQISLVKVETGAMVNRIVKNIMSVGIPEITREMLEGIPPTNFTLKKAGSNQKNLILVHGYCAGSNPWKNFGGWTNPHYFLAPNANLGHDEFACRIQNFANHLDSFSGIGHSQGGPVLLHLKNYYWSGLDTSENPYLIQSVGSPYQGCSGAGTAANLGKIFGITCGANSDLTTEGAKLWLSGIREENRKYVSYYTTTYKLGKLIGDYCNLAINLILKWPNDGTSELDLTVLPGGNNMGNKEKWCHTADMKYPYQCNDSERNALMNKNAAQ